MLETEQQTEAAKLKYKDILRLHRTLVSLMLKNLDKYYKVDLRIRDNYTTVEIWAINREGHFNWITFYESESRERWKEKLKLTRDYGKGQISLIPNNCQ